ncbi:hypothetical protein F1559_005059 [Cyanidiococcus yangmingshanensis]|uniref:J domain-containing protein n=1 Tax=Cyanidiococcus yangmingshanensis TaxID=2690220 RepID=A0A7J7IQR4_9RHOD|nr:hypothetical protein F1559_005059 [Cyanidiococcus yangmingshanensis]
MRIGWFQRHHYNTQGGAVPEQVRLHLLRLGLDGNVDWTQVRQRYRELARQSHPDVPGGNTQSFQSIQDSYNYLSVHYGRAKPNSLANARTASKTRMASAYNHSAYTEHVLRTNGSPGVFLIFPVLILVGLGSWVIIRNATLRSQRDDLRAGGTSRYVPENRPLVLVKRSRESLDAAHQARKQE